ASIVGKGRIISSLATRFPRTAKAFKSVDAFASKTPYLNKAWGFSKAVASSPLTKTTVGGALGFPLAKTIINSEHSQDGFFPRLGKNYFGKGAWANYARGGIIGFGAGWGFTKSAGRLQSILGRGVLTKSGKTRLAKLGIGLGKIAYGGGVAVAAGTGVNALQDMVGYTDSDGK
ncbi:unnamed protein product, partial [marine sediment metagenome]